MLNLELVAGFLARRSFKPPDIVHGQLGSVVSRRPLRSGTLRFHGESGEVGHVPVRDLTEQKHSAYRSNVGSIRWAQTAAPKTSD